MSLSCRCATAARRTATRTPCGAAELVAAARCVLLAAPVYNYDVNAAAKNLVELTGRAWEGKVVGLLLSAGGRGGLHVRDGGWRTA